MDMMLSQKTTQSLAITQQMEQAIKILEMDTLELRDYIQSVSLENPAIDMDTQETEPTRDELRRRKLEWLEAMAKNDRQNMAYYDDSDPEALFEKAAADAGYSTLREHLMGQATLCCTDADYPAAAYIIGHLDEDGYLRLSLEELVQGCSYTAPQIDRAIAAVRGMEPSGVARPTLSECLLAQLPAEDRLARKIVADHLHDMARGRLVHLAGELCADREAIFQAAQRIRRLNPKPGSGFGHGRPSPYVIPDVVVTAFQDRYYVMPCAFSYPSVNISDSYVRLMRQSGDKEVEAYIDKKLKQAQWLQKCIANRADTLLRVAKAIVKYQERFFRYGPRHMGVLRMSDIAGELDIHESTVSRAVKNKYLQCAHGTYPLKYFFVQGVRSTDGGEDRSSHSVKCRIRDIIDGEDKSSPLSDQRITEILNLQGTGISRRTVAKYREQLGIARSSYRCT